MTTRAHTLGWAALLLTASVALSLGGSQAAPQTTSAQAAQVAPAGEAAGGPRAPGPGLVSPCPGCGYAPEPVDYNDHAGWTQIFDGKTLDGWDGNPAIWKVEDGAIAAENTPERRVGGTFIIWRGGEPSDFELKLEIKADAQIHSGVFYRSKVGPNPARAAGAGRAAAGPARAGGATAGAARAGGATPRVAQPPPAVPSDPRWNVTGYALDFDYARDNDGNVEDTSGRGEAEIAWRGSIVRMEPGKRPRALGSIGDRDALMDTIKLGEWNELHIIAKGNQITHIINGQVMAILIDDDPAAAKTKGVIALQIEQFGTGKISFRNIWLKQ